MAYYREINEATWQGGNCFDQVTNTGSFPSFSYLPPSVQLFPNVTSYRTGSSVPGFRQKIERKLDASSDYETERVYRGVYTCANLKYEFSNPISWSRVSGYYWPHVAAISGYLPDRYKFPDSSPQALAKLYARAFEKLQSVQLLVEAGEFRSTKAMLCSDTLKLGSLMARDWQRLQQRLRIAKYVDRLPLSKFRRVASDLWLGYALGWSPLISSIDDAKSALQREFDDVVIRVRTSQSNRSTLTLPAETSALNGLQWTSTRNFTFTRRDRYCVAFFPSNIFTSKWGISIKDVPGALWSLTPYSFVVDYFFDISAWLAAVQLSSLQRVYLTKSSLVRNTCGNAIIPYGKTTGIPGYQGWRYIWYRRTKLDAWPYWMPQLKFAEGLSARRLANMVSLLNQNVPSLLR